MCLVIVTGRSLTWILLSFFAVMTVLGALITPKWLLGPPTMRNSNNHTEIFTPSVGVFNRCTWLYNRSNCADFNVEGLSTISSVFPVWWKFTYSLTNIGLCMMAGTILIGLFGCFIQSCGRKSIFDLAGVGQAIAGILYLCAMIFYAAGWNAERVKRLCGVEAEAFYFGNCTLGWAFYAAAIGVTLTFACAIYSRQAEKSTASDKVQEEMNKGKNCICLV